MIHRGLNHGLCAEHAQGPIDVHDFFHFQAVVPERIIPYFTKKHKKDVIFYKLPNVRINICMLAIRKDENERLYIKYVNKLSQEIIEIIGVDQWKNK